MAAFRAPGGRAVLGWAAAGGIRGPGAAALSAGCELGSVAAICIASRRTRTLADQSRREIAARVAISISYAAALLRLVRDGSTMRAQNERGLLCFVMGNTMTGSMRNLCRSAHSAILKAYASVSFSEVQEGDPCVMDDRPLEEE